MEIIIANKVDGVDSQVAFCEKVGMLTTAITDIKNGKRGFTTKQILSISDEFDADINWFFGKSDLMFLIEKNYKNKAEKIKAQLLSIINEIE